ncbi:NUMOD4 domain-containing protein [Pseudobacter ginsenosidimutans]|uniref:NUMOD4 motif-containing protein n=1 Tax=Pseudobacter ginsenosidimutans TaxID=661488 RepID=A0A4Q7N4E2_9BACT|nr:NUMOD4 domain-containing protein [Pseudobacter ginsenosidimutans]QEC44396.1 hypothetical protein FSB84_22975 [Pseudobacter ginsenosidimutans]RZS75865.1 NUMOD4 motif-containing protein [Pseudobacter ginsenosidimutans]
MEEIKETWRPVVGFDGYFVSDQGNLKSIDRIIKTKNGKLCRIKGRSITIRLNNFGYLDTRLYKNGKKKSAFLHRLIAEAFIPNPANLSQVNHLNGIKTDNRIENLEWSSPANNMKHAHDTGLSKPPNQNHRKVIDNCTNQEYDSIREAAKAYGIPYSTCKYILRSLTKNHTCLQLAA